MVTSLSELLLSVLGTLWVPLLALAFGLALGYLLGLDTMYKTRGTREADERRRLFGSVDASVPSSVRHTYEWFLNSRKMLLFGQLYYPTEESLRLSAKIWQESKNADENNTTINSDSSGSGDSMRIRGVVGLCHGYCNYTSTDLRDFACELCSHGFAVIAMDAEGHGYSDGIHTFVTSLQDIASDFSDYYCGELEKNEHLRGVPFFLYGVSMGGAVAFNLCTKYALKEKIHGVILACPMVKIDEDLKPPKIIVDLFSCLNILFPYAPITPTANIGDRGTKSKEILELTRRNPIIYHHKPRISTALALKAATEDIDSRMEDLEHPLLILHGEADQVTSPKKSAILFERCQSKDKTLKLYPDVWHNMLNGESEETRKMIMHDIVSWMLARSK